MVTFFELNGVNTTFEINSNTSLLPFNKLNFSYRNFTGSYNVPSLITIFFKIENVNDGTLQNSSFVINKSSMFLNEFIDAQLLNEDETFNFENGDNKIIFSLNNL